MDMERIRAAAMAYYNGSTKDQKQAAQKFFASMDSDNSGTITIHEFMSFMTSAGFQSERFYWLFVELDKDNNCTLDFEELITFFYILSRDEYRDLLNSRANAKVPVRTREIKLADWGKAILKLQEFMDRFQQVMTPERVAELSQAGCSIM